MRWLRRSRSRPASVAAGEPVVLALTRPLDRTAVADLGVRVGRLAERARVVIDVTDIPAFDSDGAEMLIGLQELVGSDRMTIVGFRQAAARILGEEPDPPASGAAAEWHVRRMRNVTVIQAPELSGRAEQDGRGVTVDASVFEAVLTQTLAQRLPIVVLDLRPVADLTPAAVQAIAFASSSAALRNQQLLIVNVSDPVAETLRRAGLSETTYVAPEPFLGA